MVVLSAAILTKSGKPLLARQFVDIPRTRIEGLLSAFPKLVSREVQHTYLETASVRYLYLPLDTLTLVLMTTKNSNVLEDLGTLALLGKCVGETVGSSVTEATVADKVFELLFTFDEVVAMGYRESVSLGQIRTFIEMDSQEERIAEMVEANKRREAKEESKRKQKIIKKQADERRRAGLSMGGGSASGGSGMSAMGGGGSMGGVGGAGGAPLAEPVLVSQKSAGGSGSGASRGASSSGASKSYAAPKKSGMQLGGGSRSGASSGTGDAFLSNLVDEGDIGEDEYAAALAEEQARIVAAERARSAADSSSLAGGASASNAALSAAAGLPAVKEEAVHALIEEKLIVELSNDGGVNRMDVIGELRLTLRDAAASHAVVHLASTDSVRGLQFKAHPNVDRRQFLADKVIAPKSADRGFPVGVALPLLKWRLSGADAEAAGLPISVSCWPSPGASDTQVTVEYELLDEARELRAVTISIPSPGGATPVVGECETGSYSHDRSTDQLHWTIPVVDSSSTTASLEFVLPFVVDSGALFPIAVSFVAADTFSGVTIDRVTGAGDDADAETAFSVERRLVADSFTLTESA